MMDALISPGRNEWIEACARATGVSHEAAGQPCQDAADSRTVPYGMQKKTPYTVILAVADGAGSAERSDEGSRLAVESALDIIESELRPRRGKRPRRRGTRNLTRFLAEAFAGAAEALAKKAQQDGTDVRQYATTLLIAVAVGDVVAAGQTGDGAIVARTGDQEYRTLITPQRGQYRNETTFITEPRSAPQIVAEKTAVDRLVLFTDGLEGLVIVQADGSPHAPFFNGLFRWIERQNGDRKAIRDGLEKSLLKAPRTRSKTHDDLSIAVACRATVG